MQAAFYFVKYINYIDKIILGFDQYEQFIDFINNINLIKKVTDDINYSDLSIDDTFVILHIGNMNKKLPKLF